MAMNILEFDSIFDGYQLYIRLIIASIIILLTLLFKNFIAKSILETVAKFLKEDDKSNFEQHKLRLINPFSWLIFFTILLFLIPFLAIPSNIELIINKLIRSILFVFIAKASIVLIDMIISKFIRLDRNYSIANRKKNSGTALNYLGVTFKAIIIIFATFLIMETWFVNVRSLIAGLGIGGIALALAAQDTASNLVAGLAIMLDKPFEIGDWVETSAGASDVAGNVEEIGIRSCRVRAVDGSLLTVPNSIMGMNVIVNGTTRPNRFVSSTLPIDSNTNLDKLNILRNLIQEVLQEDDGVIGEGNIYFVELTRGAYIYQIRYNTSDNFVDYLETKNRVNYKIIKILNDLEIKLAKAYSLDC